MKILIVEEDVFSSIGGGQTVYQNIFSYIESEVKLYSLTSGKASKSANIELVKLPLLKEIGSAFYRNAQCLGLD